MPSEIVMPRLGWTMEVGRVVEWLKADGDEVAEGDLILAIESDKAVTEVEALDSGILRIPPDPQIGVELPVGATLGLIAAYREHVDVKTIAATIHPYNLASRRVAEKAGMRVTGQVIDPRDGRLDVWEIKVR